MAHVVKCRICGERFDRDIFPYVMHSTRTYSHAHCALDKWEKEGCNGEKPTVIDPKNFAKCMYCEKLIDLTKDEYVHPRDNLYAHKECQDLEDKRPKSDRENLEKYVANLFDEDFCPAKLQRQLTKIETEYGFTSSGMLKSLIYFYDIKGNPVPDN